MSDCKKKCKIIFRDTSSVFSTCVHILTWNEMNALYWLAKIDIIIRDITDKIQQMALCSNYEITANVAKGEEEGEGRS